MDDLDRRMLALFAADPRIGVLQASRELGVARGTVQARLDKLVASGVVTGWGPELSPEALGFPVTAFLTLEIRQDRAELGGHDAVASHLATIPEVLEAHTITGAGDLWPGWSPAPTPTSSGSSTWSSRTPRSSAPRP